METEYNHKALGKKITYYRELRNLTQKKLSELTNISASYISDLENGIGNSINIERLHRVSVVLEVGLDDLLRDSLSKYREINSDGVIKKLLEEIQTSNEADLELFHNILSDYLNHKGNNQ